MNALCFFLLCGSLGFANPFLYPRFERVSAAHGLPKLTINQVFQDSRGFLWLATTEGLGRYDGYELTLLKHDPFNPNSLTENAIEQIIEDGSGFLWLGTKTAVMRFDVKNHRITLYEKGGAGSGALSSRPTVMFVDSGGRVWVGTRDAGLFRHDPITDGFTNFRNKIGDAGSLSNNRVTTIFESRTGTIWIGTHGGGINRFQPERGNFTRYFEDFQDAGVGLNLGVHIISGSIGHSAIVEDADSTLWIATVGGGLLKFNPKAELFTRYLHSPNDKNSLGDDILTGIFIDGRGLLWLNLRAGGLDQFNPKTETFLHISPPDQTVTATGGKGLHSFVEDAYGVIWLGADTGLVRFDPMARGEDRLTWHHHDPADTRSIGSDSVRCLFIDRSNTLWVGSLAGGLDKYSRYRHKFPGFFAGQNAAKGLPATAITAFLKDRQGGFWIGTDGEGLLGFNLATGLIERQFQPQKGKPGLSSGVITALCEAPDGSIWVGTDQGLERFDPQSERFTSYRIRQNGQNRVYCLFIDRDGQLWAGGEGDYLFKWDPTGDRFLRQSFKLHDRLDGSTTSIRALAQDREGRFWVGHYGVGLHRWDPDEGEYLTYAYNPTKPHGISSNDITWLTTPANGLLWIGTHGGGLNKLDLQSGRFESFTESNSEIPNNQIFAIREDLQGRLWLSVPMGLALFDPVKRSFRVYDSGDGLVENSDLGNAFYDDREGLLFYGGSNGFNWIVPGGLSHNPTPPPIVFSGFSTTGQADAVFLENGDRIQLETRQSFLSLKFAALDFTYPEKNHYAYKLDGINRDWIMNGSKREVIYTNLDEGRYTFRVKGTNSDGVWSREAAIEIYVPPPFWRTWWFYTIEVLALIGLVLCAFFFQRRRLTHRQDEALMALDLTRKTEELEQARRFQLSMLPKKNLENEAFEVYGAMRTATEVGGDYYDFFHLGGERYCFLVGDATGHGFAAGLVVGMTKMGSAILCWSNQTSVCEMVEEINMGLKRSLADKKMGMSLGVAVLDLAELKVSMAFSGLPFPYHYSARENKLHPLIMKGPPLGYFDRLFVQVKTRSLDAGDFLVFLTDGFPERFNTAGKLWGARGVSASLARHCALGGSAAAIAEGLFEDCDQFGGARCNDDDMTILVLKIKGQA